MDFRGRAGLSGTLELTCPWRALGCFSGQRSHRTAGWEILVPAAVTVVWEGQEGAQHWFRKGAHFPHGQGLGSGWPSVHEQGAPAPNSPGQTLVLGLVLVPAQKKLCFWGGIFLSEKVMST